jgi:hypothetical protein
MAFNVDVLQDKEKPIPSNLAGTSLISMDGI